MLSAAIDKIIHFNFMCLFACMYVCTHVHYMYSGVSGSWKTASDSLEQELQDAMWMLGMEPGSSTSALNHCAISPVHDKRFKLVIEFFMNTKGFVSI